MHEGPDSNVAVCTHSNQFDIHLTKAIEGFINKKLVEYPTEEKEVLKILTEVAVSRREAEIKLDEITKEVYINDCESKFGTFVKIDGLFKLETLNKEIAV